MKSTSHRISIPTILEVGHGTLSMMGSSLVKAALNRPTLFLGEGIRAMFGQQIMDSLLKGHGTSDLNILEFDDNQIESIISIAYSLPRGTDVIIAVGGGKVIDVAKYIAFLNNLPFISVPTSTSNDGYASSGCSLVINGRRTSVGARMPYGIIVDMDIIKSAPERFLYSGIGDLVSKITAVYDWELEGKSHKSDIDDFAVMIAKKSVNSVVRMDFKDIHEEFFLRELVDSLTMSGIAMEIAGNSAPASGSEHLISHALDKIVEHPQLHGIQVGIATYLMSLVQNHRQERVRAFLTKTGFFNYVKELKIKRELFVKAIDLAPEIKPLRGTYIHLAENRDKAKRLLFEDPILSSILES